VTGMVASFRTRDMEEILPFRFFTSNFSFDEITSCLYTDTFAPTPFGVEIKQITSSNSGDDFVYFHYTIINTTGTDINGLYIGEFADWDIGDYSLNRGGYDEGRNLAYQYEYGSPNDSNYYGIVALSGLNGATVTTGSSVSRQRLFEFMSTFNNEVLTTNGDYRMFIGSGPLNISVNDSVDVGFAFAAGENLEDLKANADLAQVKWDSGIVGVEKDILEETKEYTLDQNYPNPFNPTTIISYALPEKSIVQIRVFDILGSEVATLVNETQNAGYYNVNFNAAKLSSGVYIYKIQAGNFIDIKKMILIR